MTTYGQYCPIARTAELVAERWTPILLRNLLAGCETFGELLDGAPGISRAPLTQRLALLERHGVITSEVTKEGRRRRRYHLTDKGRALKSVTDAMGQWGARWLELEPSELKPEYTLWATSKLVDTDALPDDGLIVRFDLTDRPGQPVWMLLRRPYVEVCTAYLGWNEDVIVQTTTETLARWHLRHLDHREARERGLMTIDGTRAAVSAFLDCVRPSPFAGIA